MGSKLPTDCFSSTQNHLLVSVARSNLQGRAQQTHWRQYKIHMDIPNTLSLSTHHLLVILAIFQYFINLFFRSVPKERKKQGLKLQGKASSLVLSFMHPPASQSIIVIVTTRGKTADVPN